MQSANNPISHHTSHTMGNGASSSSDGARGNGARSEHFTSHTMGNGAASSSQGAASRFRRLETAITDVPAEQEQQYHQHRQQQQDARSVGNLANFRLIDSTLREGEQFATAYFDRETKLAIAEALDDFGVEYIEVTSPAASEQSRLDCEAICKLGLKAKILCHIRCHMDDARIAVQTGVDGINMCIGTSAQLMEHSHGKDMAHIAAQASEIIAYVKSHGIEIRFSGEDTFRSNFDDILSLYALMDRLGAHRVGVADTVGGATPMEVYNKIAAVRRLVRCDVGTHFHNDTGCAIANALLALEAGATHVDVTVLGIGERNGITPLGGIVAALARINEGHVRAKYDVAKLPCLEALVARAAGVDVPFNNWSLL